MEVEKSIKELERVKRRIKREMKGKKKGKGEKEHIKRGGKLDFLPLYIPLTPLLGFPLTPTSLYPRIPLSSILQAQWVGTKGKEELYSITYKEADGKVSVFIVTNREAAARLSVLLSGRLPE